MLSKYEVGADRRVSKWKTGYVSRQQCFNSWFVKGQAVRVYTFFYDFAGDIWEEISLNLTLAVVVSDRFLHREDPGPGSSEYSDRDLGDHLGQLLVALLIFRHPRPPARLAFSLISVHHVHWNRKINLFRKSRLLSNRITAVEPPTIYDCIPFFLIDEPRDFSLRL